MADSSSLYGSTTPQGTVASSNYTTLYSGGNNFVPSGDNVIISGTLTVNGCSILTDCNAFNLLPLNATTVNAFGSATAVSIGGATGVTTIQNQLSTGNYLFPLADGANTQVLATNGAGVLYWANNNDFNTTYTINASATTGGANFNLVGSDATTDTIKFAQGSGIQIVRTDADTITITNTDPGSAGVTSITGTANQVIASSSTGAVTLSTPQDIATTSSPTFAGVTAGNLTVGVATDNTLTTTAGSLRIDATDNQVIVDANLYVGTSFSVDNPTGNTETIGTGTFYNGLDGQVTIGDGSNNGSLEIGKGGRTIAGTPYIDFHSSASSPDYDVRLMASQGSSTSGQGTLTVEANIVSLTNILELKGSTSGKSQFNAPATGSNLAYTLPGSAGAANTVLTNDGSGILSWALPGGGGSTFGNVTVGVVTDNTISTTTGDLVLSSATNIVSVDNRLGINNTNPQYELHIDQGLDGYTQIAMTTTERTTILTMNDGDDLLSLSYGATPGATNRLQFSPTNQWFNAGGLGVGTATPSAALDVVGDGVFSGDVAVNGGDITTTATTANIFATNARTIQIGGAGTNNSVTDHITLGVSGQTYAIDVQALLTQQGITTQASSRYLNQTTTSPILIMSTTRTSMKGIITITDDVTGAIHSVEYLANRKGLAGTALITIYGEVYSDAPLATFTVVNNGSLGLELYATLASTNSTDIYITRNSLGAVI